MQMQMLMIKIAKNLAVKKSSSKMKHKQKVIQILVNFIGGFLKIMQNFELLSYSTLN